MATRAAGELEAPAGRPSSTTLTVAGIAVIGLALRIALVLRPLAFVDRRYVPDDTYYTLTIARSLAHGHGSTIDGSTFTSGFQPLLGFLMTPVFWLTDSADAALRADLTFLIIVDTLTVLVVAWVAYRLAGRVAAIVAAALWAISPAAVAMALGGLETSLAIFLEISLVAVVIRANDRPTAARWIGAGVVAGAATLARIDALILVALLLGWQLWRGPRRHLVGALAAGTAVVAPWWIWCAVQLGSPLPSSGSAAHRLQPFPSFSGITQSLAAGAISGGPLGPWNWFRTQGIDHPGIGSFCFWLFVAGFIALAVVWVRRGRATPVWALAATLPVFAACLLLFYAWYGVTFYFTRYLSPIALVLSIVIAVVVARVGENPALVGRLLQGLTALLLIAVGAAAVRTQAHDVTATRVPAARFGSAHSYDAITGYRESIRALVHVLPPRGVIGGWQSGALSYFAPDGLTVVNLDGVVNPEAVSAQERGQLGQYMRDRNITVIADFPFATIELARSAAKVHPPPKLHLLLRVPGVQASPAYHVAEIRWR